MLTGRVNAPEINTRHGWLNTDRAYTLKDFRGKIVLLDFWTYGCINCQHLLPDLKRLEQEYAAELVVIGVHAAKFAAEKSNDGLRQALLKFGVTHPVVNDADFEVWHQYAISAWPTVVLIDPNGKIVGQKPGEGIYDAIKPHLDQLIQTFSTTLNRTPFRYRAESAQTSVLSFPSKLIADAAGNIYLSDSGHHRVLKLTQQGLILDVIGGHESGFTDGDFTQATFQEPHGLALHDSFLYIADTKNNTLRKADLKKRQVTTIAGTGALDYYFFYDKVGEEVNPNSPWDLAMAGDNLYVASAGNHQILRFDLATQKLYRFAGTGHEALADGPLTQAAFNQPSGFALLNGILYIADPEASAVRAIDLDLETVTTLVGQGLFTFGDEDGGFDQALLQHGVGLTAHDGNLYLADTYNGKVKRLDLAQRQVETVVAGLSEPNDVLFLNGFLWITNTNAHQLWKVNLATGEREVIDVRV